MCVDAIIESGITKVVIGTLDKNPLVSGKGVEILLKNHIEVKTGVLEKECVDLIKTFQKYITKSIPLYYHKCQDDDAYKNFTKAFLFW